MKKPVVWLVGQPLHQSASALILEVLSADGIDAVSRDHSDPDLPAGQTFSTTMIVLSTDDRAPSVEFSKFLESAALHGCSIVPVQLHRLPGLKAIAALDFPSELGEATRFLLRRHLRGIASIFPTQVSAATPLPASDSSVKDRPTMAAPKPPLVPVPDRQSSSREEPVIKRASPLIKGKSRKPGDGARISAETVVLGLVTALLLGGVGCALLIGFYIARELSGSASPKHLTMQSPPPATAAPKISVASRAQRPEKRRLWSSLSTALIAASGNELPTSLEAYTRAIDLDGANAVVYNNRGLIYLRAGDNAAALADFNQALKLDPKLAGALNNRASARVALKQMDEALVDLSAAIKMNPKSSSYWLNRGDFYFAKSQYGPAISDYSEAIRNGDKLAVSYNNRGLAYDRIRQEDQALADFQKAIRLEPNASASYNNRGLIYSRRRKFDLAGSDFAVAIWLNSQDPVPYRNRGAMYLAKREYSLAIEDFSKAIELNPSNPVTYEFRANAYQDAGEPTKALTDRAAAKKLGRSS